MSEPTDKWRDACRAPTRTVEVDEERNEAQTDASIHRTTWSHAQRVSNPMLTRILLCVLIAVVAFGGLRVFEVMTQRSARKTNAKPPARSLSE